MMTLDEAIKIYEEEAEEYEKLRRTNDLFNFYQLKWKEYAEKYKQMSEWLKDYKRLLEAEKNWRKCLEDEIAKKMKE